MSRQRKLCVLLLMSAASIGWAAQRVPAAGAPAPVAAWKTELYDTVPPAKNEVKGEKAKLELLPGAIRCQPKEGNDFEIPLSAVVEITYERTSRNIGGLIYEAVNEGFRTNTCDQLCMYALAMAPLFAPFHTRAHYVTLAWRDGDDVKRTVLRVGKRDYRAILESLSKASGQPYRNLVEEQQAMRREMKRQLKNAATVRLKHDVVFGERVLKHRAYRILVQDPQGGAGEVSFFAGYEHALTMPVDIVSGGRVASAQVSYEQSEGGDWTITEIRIPGKILRFRPVEPAAPQDLAGDVPPGYEL